MFDALGKFIESNFLIVVGVKEPEGCINTGEPLVDLRPYHRQQFREHSLLLVKRLLLKTDIAALVRFHNVVELLRLVLVSFDLERNEVEIVNERGELTHTHKLFVLQ